MNRSRPTVQASVDLDLRVPRDKPGDLEDGVTALLERVTGVRHAEVVAVNGVRPSPLDIYVTARVAVSMTPTHEDPAGVREALADGFGVIDVDAVTLVAPEVER